MKLVLWKVLARYEGSEILDLMINVIGYFGNLIWLFPEQNVNFDLKKL